MSWLHRIIGKDGTTQLGVEAKHSAARMAGRPMDLGTRGAYSFGIVSGVMAAGLAANAEIFQMRWTSATLIQLIRSVRLTVARGGTAFTAGPMEFNMAFARGWSADGGGGTPIVFSTANTNKKRTDFPLSALSDTGTRFSATAALTAGTKTIDTNRLASVSGFVSSATTAVPESIVLPDYLWIRDTADEYPLLMEQNEGFIIRATVPATGTWQYSVGVEWAEIDPAAIDGWT